MSQENKPGGKRVRIPTLDGFLGDLEESEAIARFNEAQSLPIMVLTAPDRFSPLRFVHINDAFAALTGYGFAETIGQTTAILQGDETDMQAARAFRDDVERTGSGFTTLVNYRKDGSPYEVFLLGSRLASRYLDGGDPTAVYAAYVYHLRDVATVLPMVRPPEITMPQLRS
ncbi:MAG: PAS domain-containing protein [Pseudomonadota bacterium]